RRSEGAADVVRRGGAVPVRQSQGVGDGDHRRFRLFAAAATRLAGGGAVLPAVRSGQFAVPRCLDRGGRGTAALSAARDMAAALQRRDGGGYAVRRRGDLVLDMARTCMTDETRGMWLGAVG